MGYHYFLICWKVGKVKYYIMCYVCKSASVEFNNEVEVEALKSYIKGNTNIKSAENKYVRNMEILKIQ